jgi:hypothetical protein
MKDEEKTKEQLVERRSRVAELEGVERKSIACFADIAEFKGTEKNLFRGEEPAMTLTKDDITDSFDNQRGFSGIKSVRLIETTLEIIKASLE